MSIIFSSASLYPQSSAGVARHRRNSRSLARTPSSPITRSRDMPEPSQNAYSPCAAPLLRPANWWSNSASVCAMEMEAALGKLGLLRYRIFAMLLGFRCLVPNLDLRMAKSSGLGWLIGTPGQYSLPTTLPRYRRYPLGSVVSCPRARPAGVKDCLRRFFTLDAKRSRWKRMIQCGRILGSPACGSF